nr:immunoglobulin heavy chain junction region [Mus musculus]
CCLLEYFDVW